MSQPRGPFTTPEPPKKKNKGCLFWGCLGAAMICLLVVGAFAIGAWTLRKRVLGFTETQPASIPVAQVGSTQARRLKAKTSTFETALRRGRAGTFRFTDNDLNALVATVPDLEVWRGKAFVTIDGNRLIADASIPLDQVPGMRGRYVNGKVELDVQVRDGRLEVYPLGVTVKGKPLPPQLMAAFKTRNLAEQAQTNPNLRKALAHIDSLKIENGAVVIRTK